MKFVFCFCLLAMMALLASSQTIVGGYSAQTDYQTDSGFRDVNAMILKKWPFLSSATIESVQTQVVSGMNYKITYNDNGARYQIVVYSQPWTKTIKITSAVMLV